jgi:hypothetical protein
LDEEKSKCAGLTQEIVFVFAHPVIAKFGGWLVKGAATLCHQHKKKKECNKFDLTAAQCF